MTGGFDISGAAAKALAEELDTIAGAVSRPVAQWVGQAGEAHAEALGQLAVGIRSATDDLMTAAASAEGQVGADAALAAAPPPQEVEAARLLLEKAKIAAMAGNITDTELMAAAAEYQRVKGEREAALEAHTDATTNCEIPNGGVCTPGDTSGGGIARDESPDTKDGTTADTGEGGIAQEPDDGDEIVGAGADGSRVDELPGESASTPTDAGGTSPVQSTASPNMASTGTSTPSLSDTAANTELSTDGAAAMSPQAGSLGATPMQQPQPGVSAPPPPASPFTGAGSMLGGAQQQQQPARRGGGSGFGQQNDRNDRSVEPKLNESSMNALLSGGSAVAGGAAVGAAAGAMSPATTPSAAATPTAPAAPAAATPAAAPSATPAGGAGGVAPMGAAPMGSGNRAGQPVAPKPESPKVNPELMNRVDDLLKGGDPKPPTDNDKKKA